MPDTFLTLFYTFSCPPHFTGWLLCCHHLCCIDKEVKVELQGQSACTQIHPYLRIWGQNGVW